MLNLECTVVVHAVGLLLVVVDGDAVGLHPHLRVHDGRGLVPLGLGQLLGGDDLRGFRRNNVITFMFNDRDGASLSYM